MTATNPTLPYLANQPSYTRDEVLSFARCALADRSARAPTLASGEMVMVPREALSRWRKWCLGYAWPKGEDWDSHDVYLAIADEIRKKYEDAAPATSLLASEPASDEPVGWQVWWGLIDMQPHWPPFKTHDEAFVHAATIKSKTEVRPLYTTSPAAPEPAVNEDAARLDWIERKVCDVSRLGDSARTLRISWNNGADSVFVGPSYNATWRAAIDDARAATPSPAAETVGARKP